MSTGFNESLPKRKMLITTLAEGGLKSTFGQCLFSKILCFICFQKNLYRNVSDDVCDSERRSPAEESSESKTRAK